MCDYNHVGVTDRDCIHTNNCDNANSIQTVIVTTVLLDDNNDGGINYVCATSTKSTVDTVVDSTELASLRAMSVNPIMDTVVNSTKLTASDNNSKSRIDLSPNILSSSSWSLSSLTPSFLLSSSLLLLPSLLSPLLSNKFQLLATDFDINADHIDPDTDIEFSIVHQGCTLHLYLLPILYYDIQYLVEGNHINTANCECDNGVAEFTILHQGCALYLYVVPILYYDIQYLMGCNNINNTNCDNNNLRHSVVLLFLTPFLPIVMEKKKKIDYTSKIDIGDNNKALFVTTMNFQSSRSVIMIIKMVKNNQVQVCDDTLLMLVGGIYSTAGGVDASVYEMNASFHF